MTLNRPLFLGLTFAIASMLAASLALAEDKKPAFSFDHPWARPSLTEKGNSAAYFTVTNNSGAADRLVGAKTGAAKAAELHEHVMKKDVMEMRKVEGGIAVEKGATVKFAPGGLHVMLMGLTKKLEAGQSFPMTLTFEKAGDVAVEVKVETGAEPKKDAGGHQHHH
jgi:periplasmic copper chaperone A